ncbi:TPA: DUF4752 family protein [Escherichia coli]|nr:DUF4752 family protein [Escherichia coli]HBC6464250.1 DUF4752 family protein [Escherichia coli]
MVLYGLQEWTVDCQYSLQPGSVIVVTTQSGMTIQIHKPKEEGRG